MAVVYTLWADTGSYAATGYDATLTWSNHLRGDPASYALTGNAANQIFSVLLSDTFSWTSTVVAGQSITLSSTLGFAPVLAESFRPGALISETLGFAEALTPSLVFQRVLSDTSQFTDVASMGFPLTLSETLGFTPALAVQMSVLMTETLGLAPAITPEMIYQLTATDQLRLADALSRFISGTLSEQVGFGWAVERDYRADGTLTETVGFAEDHTATLLFTLTLADYVGFDDTEALNAIYNGILTDAVKFSALYVGPAGQITAWALNIENKGLTQYDNYPFNSFAVMGEYYLGATEDGLYRLDGTRDDGTDITSRVRSGFAQFAGTRLSGIKGAYLAMRGSGEFYFKLITGDGEERTYQVHMREQSSHAYKLQQLRVDIGRGIRNRFVAFELEAVGPDFDLESVEFVPMMAKRRI